MKEISHKGGLCIYKFLLCQETYCSGCYIHNQALSISNEASDTYVPSQLFGKNIKKLPALYQLQVAK